MDKLNLSASTEYGVMDLLNAALSKIESVIDVYPLFKSEGSPETREAYRLKYEAHVELANVLRPIVNKMVEDRRDNDDMTFASDNDRVLITIQNEKSIELLKYQLNLLGLERYYEDMDVFPSTDAQWEHAITAAEKEGKEFDRECLVDAANRWQQLSGK